MMPKMQTLNACVVSQISVIYYADLRGSPREFRRYFAIALEALEKCKNFIYLLLIISLMHHKVWNRIFTV